MRCPACIAARVTIAELEEELAAWRALDRDDARGAQADTRIMRWKVVLPVLSPQLAVVLMDLVDHAGQCRSREHLVAVARSVARADANLEPSRTLLSVLTHRIRRGLRDAARRGVLPPMFGTTDAGLQVVAGVGIRMPGPEARALRQVLDGEDADA